jgi:hypothetical protein
MLFGVPDEMTLPWYEQFNPANQFKINKTSQRVLLLLKTTGLLYAEDKMAEFQQEPYFFWIFIRHLILKTH